VRTAEIQNTNDHHVSDSDRGCSVETSINHRQRAFRAVGGVRSHQSRRFGSTPCRRIATSDPAKLRPRKLLRWAGKHHFIRITKYCMATDMSFQQYPNCVDNHTRCRSRATTFRRTRRRPLHIAILPSRMPRTIPGNVSQTNNASGRRARDFLECARIPLQRRLLPTTHT
jgi:hypothetical protein